MPVLLKHILWVMFFACTVFEVIMFVGWTQYIREKKTNEPTTRASATLMLAVSSCWILTGIAILSQVADPTLGNLFLAGIMAFIVFINMAAFTSSYLKTRRQNLPTSPPELTEQNHIDSPTITEPQDVKTADKPRAL